MTCDTSNCFQSWRTLESEVGIDRSRVFLYHLHIYPVEAGNRGSRATRGWSSPVGQGGGRLGGLSQQKEDRERSISKGRGVV